MAHRLKSRTTKQHSQKHQQASDPCVAISLPAAPDAEIREDPANNSLESELEEETQQRKSTHLPTVQSTHQTEMIKLSV